MSRATPATTRVPLTNPQSVPVILGYIRDRLKMIDKYGDKARRYPRVLESYAALTVVAAHSRGLAAFLGLQFTRGKPITLNNIYFRQEGGLSFEVRLFDVLGRNFSLLHEVNQQPAQQVLIDGWDTVNREILHLTYWETPAKHQSTPLPGKSYNENMYERVLMFAEQIVHLVKEELKAVL